MKLFQDSTCYNDQTTAYLLECVVNSIISLFIHSYTHRDIVTATHSCNSLVELAAKSSLPYLGIQAVAVQVVYWGVVVFNPYATLERITNFLPYYEKHKSTVNSAKNSFI